MSAKREQKDEMKNITKLIEKKFLAGRGNVDSL